MVLFNYANKEITAKIVYYGPGLCGKTTNLQFIYDSLPSNNKNKMLSLATKTDRTLFFDFLPLDLGRIRGMSTRLQLYTVPGQVYYNETRQLVLKGADGVVFVADSQDFAMDANLESLQNLEDNLKRMRIRMHEIPLVMQYNKRDLPNALPVEKLEAELNQLGVPSFESVATTGIGVEDTLKAMTKLVLRELMQKYGMEGEGALDREIQVLNPAGAQPRSEKTEEPSDASVWSEEPDSEPTPAPVTTVPTELVEGDAQQPAPSQPVTPPTSPFGDVFGSFSADEPMADAQEVSLQSLEVPLPEITPPPSPRPASGGSPQPNAAPPAPRPPAAAPKPPQVSQEPLVRDVTIPINLTAEELRSHRKLRLRIQLDVNILP